MKPDFANILSNLRRETNLSQKKAADDLGISQALLSHYENGVREPKLEFIAKACEYYSVSTDYILGRTPQRSHDGVALRCKRWDAKRNADAAALIISLLAEIGDDALSESAARYVNYCLYAVLTALRTPMKPYEPLFDAALKTAEAAFMANARRIGRDPSLIKRLSDASLKEKYPDQYAALSELEEIIGKAVSNLASQQNA